MTNPIQLSAMSSEQKRALLQQLLRQQSDASKCFAMSTGQQGLWYAFRRDPASTSFNVFLPSRVVSDLDVPALRKAIEFLVQRHPCLRTTFSDKGAKLQQTVHPVLQPEFEVINAESFDDAQLREQVLAQTQRPFDLETGPLLRLAVFVRGPKDHVVVATTHHIVVDFWSLVLVLSELREIYRSFSMNVEPTLPPASGNYAAFVADQQAMLASPQAEQEWRHWQQTLEGAPHVLNWFTDYERPAAFTGRADVVSLPLSAEIAGQVKRIAMEHSTTPAAVVLAAVQVFIARYTRENDFLIGSPFSGRGHQQYEKTVGFFVNMLPLRAKLADDPTFAALVHRAGQSLVTALEHESFPLAEIVRRAQPPRDPSRSPLFQVTCTFEKSHLREEVGRAGFLMPSQIATTDVGGIKQENFYVPHPTCHHDIEFIFEQTDSVLRGMICYCRDLFDNATAKRMAENFGDLFNCLVHQPHSHLSEIPWSANHRLPSIKMVAEKVSDPDGAKHPKGRSGHRGQTPFPETQDLASRGITLTQQLEDSLRHHADCVALIGNGESLTYGELDRVSLTIARSLQARGIARGDLVPVAGIRGLAITAAMIGVLRAGAAVVPIDTAQPAIDVDNLLKDTGAKLILVDQPSHWLQRSTSESIDRLIVTLEDLQSEPSSHAESFPLDRSAPMPEDLAYVIYTSGSTGQPKGVMIEHRAIANTVQWRCEHVSLSTDDRVLMLLSHQFDAGFGLIASTLAQGGALVWPTSSGSLDMHPLIDTIQQNRVTVLPAVPSLLQLFAAHPRFVACDSLRQIWSGGESMPSHLPHQIRQQTNVRLWNFYGPTEAAVEATAHEITDHDPRQLVPIGKPVTHTDVVVLDETGKIVPDTVPGQLAIMGRGLARGYLNREDLTDACFVPAVVDGAHSSRMYLTGDLGRRRCDGSLEFLGRMDHQVKLRGYRIELEEIEQVLRTHPAVSHVAVKVVQPDTLSAHLAAYIVPHEQCDNLDRQPDELLDAIRRHIASHLPPHKRPSQVHFISELPVGISGKVNRDRLPDLIGSEQDSKQALLPSTPLEQHIADLWEELLEISDVGVNQNFFELGGSSLQAAMMTTRLSEDLDVHVPTSLVFDLADIASIAQRLVSLHRSLIEHRFGSAALRENRSAVDQSEAMNVSATYVRYRHSLLAPLQPIGDRDPIFMVHPPGGIVICYRELALQMDDSRPFIAVRSRGLHGQEALPTTIESMAADYVSAIRSAQPTGPYVLGGWSLGGVIAYEVAKQMIDQGESVKRLILLDSTIPLGASDLVDPDECNQVGAEYGIDLTLDQLSELDEDDQLPFLWQHAVNLGVLDENVHHDVVRQVLRDLKHLFHHHVKLTSQYRMRPIDVPVLLVRPTDSPVQVRSSLDRGWGRLVTDVEVKFVPGHHHSMVAQPHVVELAKAIRDSLR